MANPGVPGVWDDTPHARIDARGKASADFTLRLNALLGEQARQQTEVIGRIERAVAELRRSLSPEYYMHVFEMVAGVSPLVTTDYWQPAHHDGQWAYDTLMFWTGASAVGRLQFSLAGIFSATALNIGVDAGSLIQLPIWMPSMPGQPVTLSLTASGGSGIGVCAVRMARYGT